jgi:hypothetical protein
MSILLTLQQILMKTNKRNLLSEEYCHFINFRVPEQGGIILINLRDSVKLKQDISLKR